MKTKHIFIIACLTCKITFSLAQTNVSGLITANTTWYSINNPYIVTGNILVAQGVTLTIQSGVNVKFDTGFYIYVDGTLDAQGTITDSIFFTSNNASPVVGDWVGIKFRPISTNNIMSYCHIEYAQNAIYIDNYSSSITNTFTISNSLIQNNQAGFYSYFDNGGLVTNNEIRNNQFGISSYSLLKFDIIGNEIIYNEEGIGDDIWGLFISSGKINNNIISHNTRYGIYWHAGSQSIFCECTGNTIDGNGLDGIFLLGYPVNITNLFQNNSIINNLGSGINLNYVLNANITYNEIAGNNIGILNNTIQPQNLSIIQNCIYQNGINFKHLNSFNIDLSNNWWGSTDSVVISSKIYDFYDDFTYGIVTFIPFLNNSFSFCNSVPVSIESQIKLVSLLSVIPNPFKQSAVLKFENPYNEKHMLILKDVEGRIISTITDIRTNSITIERKGLTNGLYFYQLKTEKEIKSIGKFVIE